MPRALFITFEGGEGAGKTTQIQELRQRLEGRGIPVLTTREPGGTPGAEAIRKLLVEGDYQWDNITETLLHFTARRDHAHKVIAPALAKGAFVLSDRFYDLTYAYQGYGQGLSHTTIDDIRKLAIGDLKPDLTFVLDLPVETGLGRAVTQQRYERMGVDFHHKLRQGFLDMASAEPARFTVINATQSIEAIADHVWNVVSKRL